MVSIPTHLQMPLAVGAAIVVLLLLLVIFFPRQPLRKKRDLPVAVPVEVPVELVKKLNLLNKSIKELAAAWAHERDAATTRRLREEMTLKLVEISEMNTQLRGLGIAIFTGDATARRLLWFKNYFASVAAGLSDNGIVGGRSRAESFLATTPPPV